VSVNFSALHSLAMKSVVFFNHYWHLLVDFDCSG